MWRLQSAVQDWLKTVMLGMLERLRTSSAPRSDFTSFGLISVKVWDGIDEDEWDRWWYSWVVEGNSRKEELSKAISLSTDVILGETWIVDWATQRDMWWPSPTRLRPRQCSLYSRLRGLFILKVEGYKGENGGPNAQKISGRKPKVSGTATEWVWPKRI